MKLCEIISTEEKNGVNTCNVKMLGSSAIVILPQSSVGLVCVSEPSTTPEDVSEIDIDSLQNNLSYEDLKKIWNTVDTTYTTATATTKTIVTSIAMTSPLSL